ncbi:uncharacterized protein PGTG_20223 [Puccinia graminis f. sp. tritici CRL 75-36-700-3]|uniref:CCHC-type domain-containing protein n=1 Tax=Puccinia graminis f. sp. tritici (strain CRL 75-36-700-3 / race SCCL) TaxID=418459 RepID=E3LC65_PUCGT|nr:uncharacterized protein PGTG_20223 [Puccinia graminis f. sp. tritici CRL 75-36-700-3]EFP94140.1 hypothetical protein PGTG_20223 [Puccinia graminis f. sp. tritici CRL 75-36-700-3]
MQLALWNRMRRQLKFRPIISMPRPLRRRLIPKLGCWNCGQKGHHSSKCSNPSLKKKPTAQASSTEARAGAVSYATLGNYSEDEENDDDSYDDDGCDVVWG